MCIRDSMYIKVPVTANGLKAISILSKEGINVTATAIYGVMPAFMAAKAGAKFLAPYVNRLDNLGSVSYTHLDVYKRQSLQYLSWLTFQ